MEKYNKIRRIMALITVILLIACIITMVILGIVGSKYFFGFLFLSIALPVILWIPLWFMNLISHKDEKDIIEQSGTEDENHSNAG